MPGTFGLWQLRSWLPFSQQSFSPSSPVPSECESLTAGLRRRRRRPIGSHDHVRGRCAVPGKVNRDLQLTVELFQRPADRLDALLTADIGFAGLRKDRVYEAASPWWREWVG